MTSASRKFSIGRHDDNFEFLLDITENHRVRIGSSNPAKLAWIEYSIISTDGTIVLYQGNRYLKVDFLDLVSSKKIRNILVLTSKERDMLVNDFTDYDLNLSVLEKCFPFFEAIKYVSNLDDNIKEARRRLQETKEMGIYGGTANKWYSNLYRFRQERDLKYKSNLDHKIYFSCLPPYQEVFKAKESRSNRLIYALDFNSMYPACMQDTYPSPKHLKYLKFDIDEVLNASYPDGFYRVVFKEAKDTFFLKYHPFRLAKSNKSYNFNMEVGDSLEVFLPRDEILSYSKYFTSVELVEGIVAKKSIGHPLAVELKELFLVKKSSTSGSVKRKLVKFAMLMASSASNPLRYYSKKFRTLDEIVTEVEKVFCIKFDSSLSTEQKIEMAKAANRLKIALHASGLYTTKIFKIDNNDAVYTLFSKTVSNSRIKMMTLIEKLFSIDSLELCYANVDSLHVSIDMADSSRFLSLLSEDISAEMGGLKVEAIAACGYWSDLGRYWLMNARVVVKYSNVFFKSKATKNPFIDHRLIRRIHTLHGFRYVQPFFLRIQQTFSYKKKIVHPLQVDNVDYKRYDGTDVLSASVACSSVSAEMIDSYHVKSELYGEVAAVQCSSNITHKF